MSCRGADIFRLAQEIALDASAGWSEELGDVTDFHDTDSVSLLAQMRAGMIACLPSTGIGKQAAYPTCYLSEPPAVIA